MFKSPVMVMRLFNHLMPFSENSGSARKTLILQLQQIIPELKSNQKYQMHRVRQIK